MDERSTPPGPEVAPPRLGRPGDPLPVRSGRQLLMVFGTMAVFFTVLVVLACWGAKNG